jgi:transcriptional regulator with XRE-family HTH domain
VNVTATRLAEAMKDLDYDQSKLARGIGVTQGAISKILLGKTANSRHLPRISAHLGVDLAWLLGETDQRGDTKTARPVIPGRTARPMIMMPVTLPPERALTIMFKALLSGIDRTLGVDEQAQMLAARLPIGLAQLQYALTGRPQAAHETGLEDLATSDLVSPT